MIFTNFPFSLLSLSGEFSYRFFYCAKAKSFDDDNAVDPGTEEGKGRKSMKNSSSSLLINSILFTFAGN